MLNRIRIWNKRRLWRKEALSKLQRLLDEDLEFLLTKDSNSRILIRRYANLIDKDGYNNQIKPIDSIWNAMEAHTRHSIYRTSLEHRLYNVERFSMFIRGKLGKKQMQAVKSALYNAEVRDESKSNDLRIFD